MGVLLNTQFYGDRTYLMIVVVTWVGFVSSQKFSGLLPIACGNLNWTWK